MIVPGNPGVPSFYEHYAKTLHNLMDGNVDIEIFAQGSHDGQVRGHHRRLVHCQDQLDHLREYLKSRKSRSRNGTVLVGHSIGVEMSLDAMDKLGADVVRGVVGLMPFVLVNTESALQKSSRAGSHHAARVPRRRDVGFIGASHSRAAPAFKAQSRGR